MTRPTMTALALALLLAAAAAPQVQAEATPAGSGKGALAEPSAFDRADAIRTLVKRWGLYVERTYDVDVGTWAMRMVPAFRAADTVNLREALARDTFEGAMLALGGRGAALDDAQVIDLLAKAQDGGGDTAAPNALGSLSADLTHTPITPCRIVDTRTTASGPIAADTSRAFLSYSPNFSHQGGSATGCAQAGVVPSAVVLNVTAVSPSAAGYATVHSSTVARPTAASVNYAAGAIVNNTVITAVPNPLTLDDFRIYSFAQSHYVVDLVGYFAPPQATALQCTQVSNSVGVSAGANFDLVLPTCASGYTLVGAGCRNTGAAAVFWSVNGAFVTGSTLLGQCSGRNTGASGITVTGVGNCCRVPGR